MALNQAVSIHGTACVLRRSADGYAVLRSCDAIVITTQPSRLLAVARAAEALRRDSLNSLTSSPSERSP